MNWKDVFDDKKIDTKNLLLYTPFDKRFKLPLPKVFQDYVNEKVFLNELYAEDVLEREYKACKVQIDYFDEKRNMSKSDFEEKESIINKMRYLDVEIDKKQSFEEEIMSGSIYPFYIRGFSGSGKTTYLHYLMNKTVNEEKSAKWINFDLYESNRSINLFGHRWYNYKFTFTPYKIISILLTKINSLLAKNNVDENIYKKNLNKIYNNYNQLYNATNYYAYKDMFFIIKQYLSSKIKYKDDTDIKENYCELMYGYFIHICNFGKKTSIKDIDVTEMIYSLLEIIVIITICQYGTIDNSMISLPSIYFTFDNIEHYINENKVYDEDIVEFTSVIQDFVDSLSNVFDNFEFNSCIKFILVVRDTTNKMIKPIDCHGEDFSNNTVDVSNWFETVEVYNKKIDFYRKNGVLELINNFETIDKAVSYIFEDRTYNGLNNTLNHMYNNNKRRITRYLFDVFFTYPERINKYVDLWEKSKTANGTTSRIYKYAARSIIRRSLLDIIEKTSYFDNLKAIDIGRAETGLGLARRILTIIYRYHPLWNDCDNYISFYVLIKELIESPCHVKPNSENIKSKIKTIVDILFHLNNSKIDNTNWCQLVDIKFNRKTINEDNIGYVADVIYKIYQEGDNSTDVYGIKITNAGKYFLTLCPEFEYFGCRYRKEKEPLFCESNYDNAIKIIEGVKKDSFKCIDKVVKFDKAFVSLNNCYNFNALYSEEDGVIRHYLYSKNVTTDQDFGLEQPHALRILNSHISYIDTYRTVVLLDDSLEEMKKTKISNLILNLIEEYANKIKELCNITSKCEGINTYYIGGYQRSEGKIKYDNSKDYVGKHYYQNYMNQLELAKKNPLDFRIRIIKGN